MEIKTTEQIIKNKARVRLEEEQIIGTILYNKDEKWVSVNDIIKRLSECSGICIKTSNGKEHYIIPNFIQEIINELSKGD